MNVDSAVDLLSSSLVTTAWISFLLLMPALLVGLMVSMVQAVTQINEQTLTFLPRFMITMMTMVLGLRWFVQVLCDTFTEYFSLISQVI